MGKFFSVSVIIFVAVGHTATALQCWSCSSDIDRACNDHFNESEILARRGQYFGNIQRNFNDRQQYDPNNGNFNPNNNQNYNPSYNPSFDRNNQNFNTNFNPNFNSLNNAYPTLETCNENEARQRRMKNVCMKKVIKGTNYVSVIRRCNMINLDQSVGSCGDPVGNGLSLEFCRYCDYDGCNAATSLNKNIFLASFIALFSLIVFH